MTVQVCDNRAEAVSELLVEVDRATRRHSAPDSDRHRINHQLKLSFAAAQRLFGVHLIVDVMTHAVPLDDASGLIAHRLCAT
ncbi:hypothetical protein D3C86_2169340 [compost metagenome]